MEVQLINFILKPLEKDLVAQVKQQGKTIKEVFDKVRKLEPVLQDARKVLRAQAEDAAAQQTRQAAEVGLNDKNHIVEQITKEIDDLPTPVDRNDARYTHLLGVIQVLSHDINDIKRQISAARVEQKATKARLEQAEKILRNTIDRALKKIINRLGLGVKEGDLGEVMRGMRAGGKSRKKKKSKKEKKSKKKRKYKKRKSKRRKTKRK
tara:strand:- start:2535 stop:3158 length:624 start_codon:yes stop_codon:yes gene_type:complete